VEGSSRGILQVPVPQLHGRTEENRRNANIQQQESVKQDDDDDDDKSREILRRT
jgi:hypothetical protein